MFTWLNVRETVPKSLILMWKLLFFWSKVLQVSSRRTIPAAEFASSFGCLPLSVLLRQLHHLRKLTILGTRSSRWQTLASESAIPPASWSASPRLTSPVLQSSSDRSASQWHQSRESLAFCREQERPIVLL